MTKPSKTKPHFEQRLSEIYAAQPHENNRRVFINENKFDCKNCSCTDFYVLDYQNSSFKILSSL